MTGPVDLDAALMALSSVLRKHAAAGRVPPDFVVLVGGTALAAHAIRAASEDVHLYAVDTMEEAVREVEKALRATYGAAFKIDITSGENLWGPILVRDIARSPSFRRLDVAGRPVDVRALSPEDLFLLKLAAGRPKDDGDLGLLVPRVDPERLIDVPGFVREMLAEASE